MKLSPKSIANLRGVLLGFGSLVTLLAAIFVEETIRGNLAWRRLEAEYASRGERIDLDYFMEAPVLDELNLFKAPVWVSSVTQDHSSSASARTKLPDGLSRLLHIRALWQSPLNLAEVRKEMIKSGLVRSDNSDGDAQVVLAGMQPIAGMLNGLRSAAAERRFGASERPTINGNLNMDTIFSISKVLLFRARVELAAGKGEEAFEDTLTALRIARACGTKTATLLQVLVATGIAGNACDTVKIGCANHAWTNDQLGSLQQAFTDLRLVSRFGDSLRLERAWCLQIIDHLPNLSKREKDLLHWPAFMIPGWIEQNKVALCQSSEPALAAITACGTVDFPRRQEEFEQAEKELMSEWSPCSRIARMAHVNTAKILRDFATQIDHLSLAETALALERYYVAHGRYPSALDALKPEYISALPVLSNAMPISYTAETAASGFSLQISAEGRSADKAESWTQLAEGR